MDLASFKELLTPAGQEVLGHAQLLEPREKDFLRHYQYLEKIYPRDLARAALEIAILRLTASSKYPQSGKMYFTREALQQASSFMVSAYRVERYRPFEQLLDLGCSIGGDTVILGRLAPTIGIDIDPLRLAMAQANAQALGWADQARFIQADLENSLPVSGSNQMAAFFDPARRAAAKRVFSVRDYTPPLDTVKAWLLDIPALGVKISPGVKKGEIASYDAEIEFVSLQGALKEAILWFGPLKTTQFRATVLPGPHTLVADDSRSTLPLDEPGAFLYEPDPAVIRAGLVAALGRQIGASQLDPDIAYLCADNLVVNPFASVWKVEDWFPFGVKRLRAYLRERNVGKIVVKKRGSPLQPEELIRMLRLKGDEQRVVFLTHLVGRPIVIVCFPPESAN
jgi:SAM-dependent methyltransferase